MKALNEIAKSKGLYKFLIEYDLILKNHKIRHIVHVKILNMRIL